MLEARAEISWNANRQTATTIIRFHLTKSNLTTEGGIVLCNRLAHSYYTRRRSHDLLVDLDRCLQSFISDSGLPRINLAGLTGTAVPTDIPYLGYSERVTSSDS